jgi:cobalt-zinc-cadmium efflux system outer membrane protein
MKLCIARFILPIAFFGSLATGCVQYAPKPLDAAAVERALEPPTAQQLRADARALNHPILAPVEVDLADGLSPVEASILAVLLNPEVRAERTRQALADAQLLQAGLLPNPQLSAGLDLPFSNDAADSFTGYNAGLSWDVTSLLTHRAHREAAAADAQSVLLDVAWKEWQLAEAAKIAVYDAIAFSAELDDARALDLELLEGRDAVRRAFDRHDKTLLELSAAETAYRDAHVAVLALEGQLAHARLVLNRSIGLPPDAVVQLQDDQPLPSRLEAPATQELATSLMDRRLDLLALRRGYESQEATLRAAVLAQFPKINLGATVARDTSRVNTVGLGATIDIPLFDRNQGVIAAETATRQKLFDEYVLRVFTARSDLEAALTDLRATNDQIAAAEAALPGFQTLARSYRAALEQGNADALSAYTAETTFLQRRIEVVKLKQQLVQNWVALELACGRYLPMHLLPSSTSTTTGVSR